MLRFFKINQK